MNQPIFGSVKVNADYSKQVEYPVAQLYAGISQQPPASRFPNQVSDASNVDFSVLEGMTKRAGTRYERKIDNSVGGTALGASGTYRLHEIRRDDVEQFDVVYGFNAGDLRLRVFEFGGPEATVTRGSGVEAYLESGSPTADDLKFITVTDATFIVNTKVATGLLTSPSYTLTRTYKNADVLTSNTPAVDSYHRALADGVDLDSGYYKYTPGGTGATPFPTIDITPAGWSDWVDVNGSDWSSSGRKGFRVGFQRKPLSVNNAVIASVGGSTTRFTLTLAGAFTNYTFEQGDQFRLNGESVGAATYPGTETAGWVTVVSRDSNDQCTVDAATPTGPTYAAGRSVVLADTGGVDTIDITTVGREYEILIDFSVDFAAGDIMDLDDIAARIQREFRNQSEDGVTVAWIPVGNVGKFRIGGPWRGSDATIIATQPPTSGSSMTDAGEPFSNTAADYTITAGTSTAPESVRVDVADRWTRVPPPSQTQWKPDPSKMPVKMTRTSYTGDGSTPATFSIDQIAWTGRDDGDETTNPAPQMLIDGDAIADIAYKDDRFIIAGQERMHFSAASDLFNFYKENEEQTADGDPVTVALTGAQVSIIGFVVPYRDAIHVFTESGNIFEVRSDGPITPSSMIVTQTAFFNYRPIRPQVMDGRIIFVARDSGGDRTRGRLMEYIYDDSQAQNIVNDLTAHAARIFDSLPIRMTVIPELSMVLTLTTDDDDRLYVHRSHFINNQRQQSAWTKYDFDSSYRICDIGTHQSGLRMLVEKNSEYHIEALKFEYDNFDEDDETGADFTVRLDSLYYATGVYSAPTTTWTLPFAAATLDTAVGPTGASITVTPSGSTVTATGDYSSGQYAIGRKFPSTCTFSKQYVRGPNGVGDVRNFPIIKRASFHYRRAGSFSVAIDRPGSAPTMTTTFSPKSGNTIEGFGSYDVFNVGPSDQASITLTSTNAYPFSIQQVQFEAHVAKTTQPS